MYDQIISGSVSNHRTKEIQQRIHPARILLQGPPNSSYSASEPTVGITAGSWCIHRSESPCAMQGTHTRKVCVRKMRAREKQSHVILQSNLFSLFLPWSCSYWENQSISQGPGVYKHDALHSPKPLSTSYTQRGLRGRVLPPHCLRVLVHHRMALPRQLLQLSPPPCARVINLRPYRHHVPVRCNFYADLRLRPKPVMGSTISKPVHPMRSTAHGLRGRPGCPQGDLGAGLQIIWQAESLGHKQPLSTFPWNLKILDKTSHQVNASIFQQP